MTEIAQLIVSIATLVTAIGSVLVSLRNSQKVDKISAQTDGMKTELVDEVRKASFARGVKSETDKQPGIDSPR